MTLRINVHLEWLVCFVFFWFAWNFGTLYHQKFSKSLFKLAQWIRGNWSNCTPSKCPGCFWLCVIQPLVMSQHSRTPLGHFQFLLDHRCQQSKCSHTAVTGQGWRQQGAAGSLQRAQEVKVGTSASSPWQEKSLRKMNTLMGKGVLFLSLLKTDINSYWKLNAKLNASWGTVVVFTGLLFTNCVWS